MSSTEAIAERVSQARKDANVSEAELARDTNIARTTLQRKLAGARPFNTAELIALSGRLSKPVTYWFEGL